VVNCVHGRIQCDGDHAGTCTQEWVMTTGRPRSDTTGWRRVGTRARGVVAVVAAGTVLMAGCTVEESGEPAVNDIITSDVAPEEFAEQVLDWGTCDSGASGTECATYEVPLNYDDPDGERVEIPVKRFPASGTTRSALCWSTR